MTKQYAICFDHAGYRRYLQFIDKWPDGLWGARPMRFSTIEEADRVCGRFKSWPDTDKRLGRTSRPYVVEHPNQ